MTVTNKTNTVEEAGNGSKVAFTFDFKTPAAGDLEVYEVDGTTLVATLLTITTHYTVALNTATEGGTVTYVTAPASGKNSFIKRVMDLDQQTDVPTEGNIPEASLNNEYDKSRMIDIQQQDELDRCLKFATTSTLSNFTVPEDTSAANRANKTIAYDTAGTALTLGQSIGTYKGDWATATSYLIRDLVKDTSNNNIYIANEAHTSTGSQPISSNADVAKWDLLVDTATLTDASEATSIKFTFDNSTSMADPGTGDLRFDNATVGSVTNIAVDATSADTGNPDISAYIADLTSGSNVAHEGYIVIKKGSTPATFAVFSITGVVVDNTGWLQIPVTHVASAGAWTAADNMYLTFSRSGNRGRAAGLDMTFEDTTTDTDQGVGKTWLNHATPGSATVFYMDDVDANSTNINSYLDSWDDSSSSVKGHIIMSKHSDPAVFALYNVTGSVTSASTYSKVAVTYVTGAGSFTDADPVAVVFVRGGDKGDTGATGGGLASIVDDTTPQLGGFLDANGNYMQTEKGGDIASASPLVIDTDGDYFNVTGTVSFAAMTVAADRQFTLQFDGVLTMTHHATNLDLPGEANITTAAGDVATFQSTGSNTVQCINYTRADGTGVVAAAGGGWIELQSESPTASSSVSMETGIGSTYTEYMIKWSNVYPSTDDGTMRCQLKIGGSYVTDSTYQRHSTQLQDNSTSYSGNANSTQGYFQVAYTFGNAAGEGSDGTMYFSDPTSTDNFKRIYNIAICNTSGGRSRMLFGGGSYTGSAAALTGVKLYMSVGNFSSGEFTLYGLTKA